MLTILITKNTEDSSKNRTGGLRHGKEEPRTLLLREGLRTMGMGAFADLFTPDLLEHTQDGKPFIPGLPEIHFNLSHSGGYIACAFSDREIGLDLQEHSRTHTSIVRIAKRFFSAQEYEAILALPPDENGSNPDNSACRIPLFYRLWSIKEAYLKYLGCGLRGGMNSYLPDPIPASGACGSELFPQRGKIHVLRQDPLLVPAEFALLRAPENYTMALCAAALPEEIGIKFI